MRIQGVIHCRELSDFGLPARQMSQCLCGAVWVWCALSDVWPAGVTFHDSLILMANIDMGRPEGANTIS